MNISQKNGINIKHLINYIGKINVWSPLFLVIAVFIDVTARYLFNKSTPALLDLEWHLFSIIFLLGISYALQQERHVRVDIFYNKLPDFYKNLIELLGHVLFLIPLCLVFIVTSAKFAFISFNIAESSPEPGGLPYRFIIKSIISLGFFMLLIEALAQVIDLVNKMRKQ